MEAATSRSKKISVSIKDFNEAIITAMKGRNPIDLPELISAIELSTGLSGVSVRQRLLSTEALEIASVKGRRCKSVYCGSFDDLIKNVKMEKVLLRRSEERRVGKWC